MQNEKESKGEMDSGDVLAYAGELSGEAKGTGDGSEERAEEAAASVVSPAAGKQVLAQ